MASAPVEAMLARLERVKRNGDRGWTCRCPAHEDKSSSLSVTEGRNGSVLLNCFAGCPAISIVHALGLQMKDLFVRRPTEDMTASERAELHELSMRAKWQAALDTLSQEATVVAIAAAQLKDGPLNQEDMSRLNLATRRIADARRALKVGPNNRRQSTWRPKQ